MSDTSTATTPNLVDRSQTDVTNPASNRQIFCAGTCFLILALLIFYVLVASWPTLDSATKSFKSFQLFGQSTSEWSSDQRMFLTVVAAGAIGSLIHTLTSLGDYIGNQNLSANWLWWFVLRTPIGIALALVFYLLLRGGLIIPTNQQGAAHEATAQLNPYGVAGFSALAGMFSRQATDKLREVFETLFTAQRPVKRDDPLNAKLALVIDPPALTKGLVTVLTVTGSGFQKTLWLPSWQKSCLRFCECDPGQDNPRFKRRRNHRQDRDRRYQSQQGCS